VELNYHHLRYFRAVAQDGNLTRTARRLRVAQSSLSTQIRQLEEALGHPLFLRESRGLALTEAGQVALTYADDIFCSGDELVSTLKDRLLRRPLLRIGAVATLSRNFQRSFVRPVLERGLARLRLTSGSLRELLGLLASHELDLVLSNRPASGDERAFRTMRIARQPVSLVSAHPVSGIPFPQGLDRRPMILPGPTSELRMEFDSICARHGVRPRVVAEVDDMATMRLLARDTEALVLVPSVVVRDELREGRIYEVHRLPDLVESFYAIVAERRFQLPLVDVLLKRSEEELLFAGPDEVAAQTAVPEPVRRRTAGTSEAAGSRTRGGRRHDP
jgi:LysR family transcriptional activator of nhaA